MYTYIYIYICMYVCITILTKPALLTSQKRMFIANYLLLLCFNEILV